MSLGSLMNAFRMGIISPGQHPNAVTPQASAPASVNNNPTIPNDKTPQSDGSHAAFPAVGQTGADGKKAEAPLDNFKDVWQAPDKPAPVTPLSPSLNFDNDKLMAEARKMDFTAGMPAEISDKLKSGDAASIQTALSWATQNAFAQAIGMSSKITEAALAKQADTMMKEHFPKLLKDHQIQTAAIPGTDNPAISGMRTAIQSQLSMKNPNATAAQINEMTGDFMQQMAAEIIKANGGSVLVADQVKQQQQNTPKQDIDWEALLAPAIQR